MEQPRKFWFSLLAFILCLATIGILPAKAGELPTPDQYWSMIRKAAASEFSGMDIALTLNTAYTYDPDESTHGATVGVSVPLYSKKDKLKRRSDVNKFLADGAELIQKLETSMAQRQISVEQSKFLQAKFGDEGIDAVNSYFDVLKQVAELDARITQYHREIQSLINPYLEKPEKIIPAMLGKNS